ncbi:MAG: hypothetical protein ACRELC_05095 [Gemmatimonadota bacterium]
MRAPRLFPSNLSRNERRVYAAVTLFYVVLFFGLIWPVYPRFAGIQPRVLGIPFSLAYVVACVVLSFLVLLALFEWERGRERRGNGRPDAARDAPRGRRG